MTLETWTGNFSELSAKCSSFLREKGFSGITTRSLRNYFDKGCISAGNRSGRNVHYSQDHIIQVLMVKHFLSQGFTLKQISTHLLNHTDTELKSLFSTLSLEVKFIRTSWDTFCVL
ncbi:MerR family transcriptional regulator [uncultured Kiloniella sp.]|uniref:MerR family transcriptional regulator n=1 Tax=uncultured Kiloniella sp. TaxID=1133091 RepID=UPI0026307DDB|nr:MerR family transcriptional regulator [uncultured Kiloniella sp.]